MMNKFDKADLWLMDEITKGLMNRFGLRKNEAEKMIKKSNLMRLLITMPDQVHHESPDSWVNTIARQMNLREAVY